MRRRWSVVWLIGALAVLNMSAQETPRSVIDFEKADHGWMVFPGFDGRIELTRNPLDVKEGTQALQYTYVALQGKLNGIVRLEPEDWAQAFRFWVKTDRPTLLAMVIQEEGGERWNAPFWVNGNRWQQVTLTLSDFTLAEDVKPENNRLDMDKAQAIGLLDVGALFFTAPEAKILFGDYSGTRVFWMDQFEFLAQAPLVKRSPNAIDEFGRDFVAWIATQGVTIQPEAGGMSVQYESLIPIFGVLRPLEKGALNATQGLEIVIQVKAPTTLGVFVEEEGGERWQATLSVGGEKAPEAKRVLWSAFTVTDDTKEKGNGTLEPNRIKMIGLADLGALMGEAPQANRWLIQAVRKIPK